MFNNVDPKEVAYIWHAIFVNLTPDLRKKQPSADIPSYGYYYVASEAFYHMIGKKMGLQVYRARDVFGDMHYWLATQASGSLLCINLDLTVDQYKSRGIKFDYTKGKHCAFLTKQPSQRTRQLIIRARKTLRELTNVHAKRGSRTVKEVPK